MGYWNARDTNRRAIETAGGEERLRDDRRSGDDEPADVGELAGIGIATLNGKAAADQPGLFARITERLVFSRLSYDVQFEIARHLLAVDLELVAEKGLALSCSPAVLPFLVQRGFHPRLGARPTRDVVEKHVRDAASAVCLGGSLPDTGELIIENAALRIRAKSAV